jgi:hypothetical protein
LSSDYDLDELRRIVEELYAVRISRAFGDPGMQALRRILSFVQSVFSRRDAELLRHEFVVFRSVSSGVAARPPNGTDYGTLEPVLAALTGRSVVELLDDGGYRFWHNPSLDVRGLSTNALVYRFADRADVFIVNTVDCVVPRLFKNQASGLSAPRFRNVLDALEDYKANWIRTSRCYVFQGAWHDPLRLEFKRKPERILRRSLEQFLASRLGSDVEVVPEHIVDESHPVDIRVLWSLARQELLIEIKWLGVSTDGRRTTTYTASRAQEGARQLVDYLDSNKARAGTREVTGLLVIYDARRRRPKRRKANRDDGFYYEHREISFMPDFAKLRSDFQSPRRFFAEPRL